MSDLSVGTHWNDCWKERAHHGCAVARIRELEARIEQLEAALREIADKADDPRHVAYEEACIAKAALAGLAKDQGGEPT